ncbi:MAG: hypothetical protein ACYDBB_24440 [Armatimonadota bacterium]
MLHEKGLNDRWIRPKHLRKVGQGHYAITLTETLGQAWPCEIVSYALPAALRGQALQVTLDGQPVPSQVSGETLSIQVNQLSPGERRTYNVRMTDTLPSVDNGVSLSERSDGVIFTNGVIALKLPASGKSQPGVIPGPILAVLRGNGPWRGEGRLEGTPPVISIATRLVEAGPLWSTAEVTYSFEGDYTYRVRLTLRPGDDACEVWEESTLPVRLWPAPRPYREIGCLGASFWSQSWEDIAKPCLRPCPTGNFIFDMRAGFAPDRMVTHSTSSWEIVDMPLGLPALKTYTAMRPALPSIDGAWLGVYDSGEDDLVGVASLDITHWQVPDEQIHPAHRTPGASAEVLLVDAADAGTHLRFPVQNVVRKWLIAVVSRRESVGLATELPAGQPVRLEPNQDSPLWALRRRRGDLRLDKVKDWITEWPDAGAEHPRVFCRPADFPAIREKINTTPELRKAYEASKDIRSADRYIMTGEASGLAAIEEATHGEALVQGILQGGFAGPTYAIGLARPMRRYAMACDIMWDSFTSEEKRRARRVCALAAYIMTDGDWWQYAYRANETTYLPNFNSDVFCCAGLIGLFLSDHPNSKLLTKYLVKRMDLELRHHLRIDGGGDENVGNYLISTWTQLLFPALWALRQNGVKDYSADRYVHAGARFLLATLGPADPRDDGLRMMPPIGHHPYARKDMPLFPMLAAFVKDVDPELAANMMWGWRATGAPVRNFWDHSGSTANPLTRQFIFHDPTIPEIPPNVASANLPHVGAVLRSHSVHEQASYLFLKAGRVHSHHDDDEGSFHYIARGIPLAMDGLPLENGATAAQHNAVTFDKLGQPSGLVEHFTSTPAVDYVRARIAPRAFPCDSMYIDHTHRSGFTRELVYVKSPVPNGIEYLVVKDTAEGPEACQWNLDVLSRQPKTLGINHLWFPGHPEFDMGLEVIIVEPENAVMLVEEGWINEKLRTPEGWVTLKPLELTWTINEHWLLHLPAEAGATFLTVLFPRRNGESAPRVEYLAREETLRVTHGEGRELIFLRPNPAVGTNLDGVTFQGRAGVLYERGDRREIYPLDAVQMRLDDYPGQKIREL